MRIRSTITAIAATAAVAILLPASAAQAEYLIPPGNSAVNQYTEGVPSASGERDADGPSGRSREPADTIGTAATRKLEERGREGQEAAELLVETSPVTAPIGTGEDSRDSRPRAAGKGTAPDAEGTIGEDSGGAAASGSRPSGTSGLASVVAAATGSSDGGIGLLLPLVMLAALAWGATVARRHYRSHGELTSRP